MVWSGLLAVALLAAVVLVVPGLQLGTLLRLRGAYWWALAPGLGLGAFGLLTLVWGGLGFAWGWPAWFTLLGGLAALQILQWARRRGASRLPLSALATRQSWWAVLGVLTYVTVRLLVVLPAVGAPDAVPHLGDSAFHMQGALLVYEGGDVFPLGALSDLYTPDQDSSYYYPTVWHALVSLLMSFAHVAPATNGAILAVSALLWPASVVALALALRPQSETVGYWAPLILIPISMFPGALGIAYSVYPFALSMVALPAALAAVLLWQRKHEGRFVLLFVLVLTGALAAQPSGAVFPLVAAAIALLQVLSAWVWRAWTTGKRTLAALVASATLVAVVGATLAVRFSDYVAGLAAFPRETIYENPVMAYLDGTVAATSDPWWPWVGVLVCAVGGAVLVAHHSTGRVYVVTTAVAVVAFIASAGPDSALRALTGPWYKDHVRLGGIAAALTVVLAAVFVAWLFDRLIGNRVNSIWRGVSLSSVSVVAAVVWVVATPSISELERAHIQNGYRLDDQRFSPLTDDTAALLGRLDDHFESGTRLLAAHGAGGAFVVVYSQMKPMIPLIDPLTGEQKLLVSSLDEINDNPEICEILLEHNVVAFMSDVGRVGSGDWGPIGGPPILDTDDGFELVDSEGDVMVWRITACD